MKTVYGVFPTSVIFILPLLVTCTNSDDNVQVNLCNSTIDVTSNGKKQAKCSCNFVSVDCSNLGIKDLPSMMTFPKNTFTATFSGNYIEEIEFDAFYSGKDLIKLDLSHNRIMFISPQAFEAFKNLDSLSLDHNRLWNLPWKVFRGLPSLKYLDLSFNHISKPALDAFDDLSSLENLKLNDNPIYELEPKHFQPLTNLLYLNLDSTVISSIADRQFVYTPNLKILSIAHNLMEEIPTVAFKPLKHLKNLDFSGNPVKIVPRQAFKNLDNLLVLHLDRMPVLERIDPFALGDLKNLAELHCSYNYMLSEIDSDAFVNVSDGKKISPNLVFLRQNNLYKLPSNLMVWSKNLDLDLAGNPWDCHCHTQWLIYLRTKNKFQDRIMCSSPPEFEGRSLDSLKETDLPCGMSISDVVTIAVACALAFALICTLVAFLYHRKRFVASTRNYADVYKPCTVDEDVIYEKQFSI